LVFLQKLKIMSKNTSITLGSYFDQFIQSTLREGRYKNASEVVRAGLRLLEEEEQKIIALRHAIDEGINSGLAEDFNPEEHLKSLKAKRK
jgi:antitoxin ParD1/3/4